MSDDVLKLVEELKKAQIDAMKQQACPHCGYCPHCGHSGYNTTPWPSNPPYYWEYPYVTCDSTKVNT